MESDIVETARSTAEANFESGLYCAESVVLALARAQGVDAAPLTRAATGFCGGLARTAGPCGAVTGAIMGLGLAFGRNDGAAPVDPAYRATQRFIAEFEQLFGDCNCKALLGCDLGTQEGQAQFRARNLRAQCARYTGEAAEIAARLIVEARPAAR